MIFINNYIINVEEILTAIEYKNISCYTNKEETGTTIFFKNGNKINYKDITPYEIKQAIERR